jgi:16S rRNA pseudouridine516 synthase
MRLDKYISFALGKTRSEARNEIKQGKVMVNNQVIRKNDWTVDEYKDQILFDSDPIQYKKFIYIMLNKPSGYLSATKDEELPTVIDLIEEYRHYDLFMVGRLDLDAEGLMILTNDGKFAHQITNPKKDVSKKYYVKVEGEFSLDDVSSFREGLMIYDGNKNLFQTKPATLDIITSNEAYITISEGKYHQVKKMCLKVGKTVTYLKRLQIGGLMLDSNLETGEYREITLEEKERILEG